MRTRQSVPISPSPDLETAFERHYTPKELADLWILDESTIRRLFIDEPGVMKYTCSYPRSGRREYVTLRIPESVAHAHRFRHTLATELLGNGASFEEVGDILGNSPEIVRKHSAKWSPARQNRIDDLMSRVHSGANWTATETAKRVQ